MNPSLKAFKGEYQSRLLDFLWRQWSAFGVAGQTSPEHQRILDPEGLLLLTCTVGRHDPRLFDEMLDWLHANGWLINVMRLKRILRTEKFTGERVLAAVAGLLAKGAETPKWKQLADSPEQPPVTEKLFFGEDGTPLSAIGEPEPLFARYGWERGPLRLRGYSQEFRPTEPATLVLQLRALLGINVRCEIVLYLLTHDAAHPSQIARDAYYFDRAVQGTLADMSRSGVIQVRATGREKYLLAQAGFLEAGAQPRRVIGTEMGQLAAPVQCAGANLVATAERRTARPRIIAAGVRGSSAHDKGASFPRTRRLRPRALGRPAAFGRVLSARVHRRCEEAAGVIRR